MAKSALRIRFVWDRQGRKGGYGSAGQARQRFGNDFASQIVRNFAFRAADDLYDKMVGKVKNQFMQDARRELIHMTTLFRQFIIGADPEQTRPAGRLSSVTNPETRRISIAGSIPDRWAARNPDYLKYKRSTIGHKDWFSFDGVLKEQTNAASWEDMFGPIRVRFVRTPEKKQGVNPQPFNTGGGGDKKIRLNVGTIQVFALTNITPAMLPALTTGRAMTMNKSTNPGLVRLLGEDTPLAYRLGGENTAKQGGHVYRPTLEPFLAYYLTTALPSAVQNRLTENMFQNKNSSAGRTRSRE